MTYPSYSMAAADGSVSIHQEESYAAAPGTIEQEEDNLPTLSSAGGFGARRLVAIALIAVGLLSLS